MGYIEINMGTYKRRDHFSYFKSMAYPYVGLTVEVDITEFIGNIKSKGAPFFFSFMYAVCAMANRIPQFRQRIKGDGIIEYTSCPASYTVALEEDLYCYCCLDCSMPFDRFLPYAAERQRMAIENPGIKDGDDVLSYLFISSVPWTTYTALIQPVPFPADSNPRITWGKYFRKDGRTFIPVTVLLNHALADGKQIALFFDYLTESLQLPQSLY